ncbi:hypothetical protein GCM10023068_17220 [Leifsonia shinshuensis]
MARANATFGTNVGAGSDGYAGGVTQKPDAERPARRSRRVQRAGAPGADPTPRVPERDREEGSWSPNDEQLRRDVPPHY